MADSVNSTIIGIEIQPTKKQMKSPMKQVRYALKEMHQNENEL